jgi:protocatechuate 3,4-dioxygenase beta subunit
VKIEDERFAQPVGHRDIALGTPGPYEFRLEVKDSSIILGRHIPLTPGLTISGRAVYESTGKPAAGIRVGAQQRPRVDAPHALGGGSAVTDGEGRYTVKQLVPGRYNVALDLRGELNRSWTAVAHEDVILNQGDHLKGVDFALIPGAVIAGQVTGQETGVPIAGVLVGVYGPAHPRSTGWVQNTETAADGSYFLRVPAGKQHLYLQGKWPAGFSSPEQRRHDIELEDGDTRRVDFALPGAPLKPIHGRVLGPDGRPVPGAEVIVLPSWRIIKTGAEGEFALEPAEVKLRARQGDLATERAGKPSTEGEVVLRLKEDILASVTGLVTDATEKPVADAHVGLFVGVYGQWPPVGNGVTTDAEGRYRFASLWPHQIYQVAVRQKSEGREPGSDTTFELGTAEVRELPTLRAAAAAPRG